MIWQGMIREHFQEVGTEPKLRRRTSTSYFSWGFWMKSLVPSIPLSLSLLATPLLAATYYVDGGCTQNGNGTLLACTSESGGDGPYNDLQSALNATAPGNTIEIRGQHSSHGLNHAAGTYEGRYTSDRYTIDGKDGTSSSRLIVRAHGWTSVGASTQESVYIESTKLPSSGWTQCSNCSSGTCAGIPGTCNEVWFATDSSTAQRVIGAQRDDGTPTRRETSAANVDTIGESYSPQTVGATILVRWGTTLPSKPYVFQDNFGIGFTVTNSDFIEFYGLIFRCHQQFAIEIQGSGQVTPPPVTDIVIQDNRILYNVDRTGRGNGYGLVNYNGTRISILDNEIGWTDSEGIHSQAVFSGATVQMIQRNWIHDLGDQAVLGPASSGTPSGMILGDYEGGTANGDYAGSLVEGNLIQRIQTGSSMGQGIILENHHDGDVLKSNIIEDTDGACLTFGGTASADDNQVYNNVLIKCGQSNGWGINFQGTAKNNKLYNNTIIDVPNESILSSGGSCSSTTCSGNLIRNNLFVDVWLGSRSFPLIDFGFSSTFENNLVYSTLATNLVKWNGTNYTCSTLVSSLDPNSRCADPVFTDVGSKDFHIRADSPARNAGTSGTEMGHPSGHTASINNTLAVAHGLPHYSDNVAQVDGLWDIGATEVRLADASFESGAFGAGKWNQLDLGCDVQSGSIVTTLGHTGANSANIAGSQIGPKCGGIYQTLTGLSTTRTYRVVGWWKSSNATDSKRLQVAQSGTVICTGTSTTGNWVNLPVCTFTPTSSTIDLQFYLDAPVSGSVSVNLDDIDVL